MILTRWLGGCWNSRSTPSDRTCSFSHVAAMDLSRCRRRRRMNNGVLSQRLNRSSEAPRSVGSCGAEGGRVVGRCEATSHSFGGYGPSPSPESWATPPPPLFGLRAGVSECTKTRPNSDRCRPNLARGRPRPTFPRERPKIARNRPDLTWNRPNLARTRPNLARNRSKLARIGPLSTDAGPEEAESGPNSATSGQRGFGLQQAGGKSTVYSAPPWYPLRTREVSDGGWSGGSRSEVGSSARPTLRKARPHVGVGFDHPCHGFGAK